MFRLPSSSGVGGEVKVAEKSTLEDRVGRGSRDSLGKTRDRMGLKSELVLVLTVGWSSSVAW